MTGSGEHPVIVVIGVGNPYRGDDGAGLEVARQVRHAVPAWVEVGESDGEPAGLLDSWEDADVAVVIDAVRSGAGQPGAVYRVEVDRDSDTVPIATVSSHSAGPGDAVALARVLDRLPGRLVLFGIEGAVFSAGVGLSPEVEDSVARVAGRVVEEVSP
jgi:hydrogenase maturation protease